MTARTQRAPITLPLPVTRPEHWTEGALCARPDVDAEWFDTPHDGESRSDGKARIDRAKAVCNGTPSIAGHPAVAPCPVRAECAAAVGPGDSGVRAGRMVGARPSRAKSDDPIAQKGGRPRGDIVHGTEQGARTHWRRGEKACPPCLAASNAAKRDRTQVKKRKAS